MMRTIKYKQFKINICVDILEWGREFYGIPKEAKLPDLQNRQDLESECMGFAEPTGREIWVFLPKEYDIKELSTTIAHEIGHCMQNPGNASEKKANHYEMFYQLVTEITTLVSQFTPK